MGLVEEEDEFGAIEVPHLGQLFEEFGEQVKHEGDVDPRVLHQARGIENADHAVA